MTEQERNKKQYEKGKLRRQRLREALRLGMEDFQLELERAYKKRRKHNKRKEAL